MSQVSEIKCPVCGKWSNGTGRIDEKCPNCNAQRNPERLLYEEEKKINTERAQKDSYFMVKDTDDTIVVMAKQFINWLRWGTFYGLSVIYFFIAFMIIVFGLVVL